MKNQIKKSDEEQIKSFLNSLEDQKRDDSIKLVQIIQKITRKEPYIWDDGIIGFGTYTYRYASGKERDWFLIGFAPRKNNITIYLLPGLDKYEDLLAKLGKHKAGKSSLYIRKLEDLDGEVLVELIKRTVSDMREEK